MTQDNIYTQYVEKTKECSSLFAELTNYICDFFQQNGFGVLVEIGEVRYSKTVIVRHKLQRDKDFNTQALSFYESVDELCTKLHLEIIYQESRRWDACIADMPIFGEEIIFLSGDD